MFTQTILNFCISELKEKSWGVDSNRTILQLVSPTLESGKDQLICPYLAPDLCDFFKSWIILNAYYNEKIRWIKHQNLNQSWRKLLTKLVYSCAYLSILVIFLSICHAVVLQYQLQHFKEVSSFGFWHFAEWKLSQQVLTSTPFRLSILCFYSLFLSNRRHLLLFLL